MTPHDDFLLTTFFASDSLFWQSPMGAMIAHLRARSCNSDGRRILAGQQWDWLPPADSPQWWPGPKGVEQAVFCKETISYDAGSYVVSDLRMANVGKVNRRMLRISPRSYTTLARYYGDAGKMWSVASQDRYGKRRGKDVLLCTGIGPGAIASLYVLTEAGQMLIAFERDLAAGAPDPRKKPSARGADHDAHRAALENAIASKVKELEAVGEALDERATLLGELRVQKERMKADKIRVSSSIVAKLAALRDDMAALRDERIKCRRSIHQLQLNLVFSRHGAAPPGPNPKPDADTKAILDQRLLLTTDYELALAEWTAVKTDLVNVCGEMADDDRRLPPKPTPPDLPMLPMASTIPLHARAPREEVHLSDDDRLHVSFLLAKSSFGAPRDAERRRLLLKRAGAQAEALIHRAWSEWLQTKSALPRAPRLQHDAQRPPHAPPAATHTPTTPPPPPSGPRRIGSDNPHVIQETA